MENRFVLILVLGLGTKGFAQTNGQYIGWQYGLYPSGNQYTTVSKSKLYGNFTNRFNNLNFNHAVQLEVDQFDFPFELSANRSSAFYVYDFSYAVDLSYAISEFMEVHLEFEPSLTSNLEKALSTEDIFFYGGAYALMRGKMDATPFYFKFGVSYSSYLGEPEFLPVLTFFTRVSEKLSFTLGFPESGIMYKLVPSGTLSAGLLYEGKYVNLSAPFYLNENDPAEKLKWEWTSLTVHYSYELNELWSFEVGGGYLLKNDYSLRNERDETLSTITLDPSPFLSSGIKLMFN